MKEFTENETVENEAVEEESISTALLSWSIAAYLAAMLFSLLRIPLAIFGGGSKKSESLDASIEEVSGLLTDVGIVTYAVWLVVGLFAPKEEEEDN